MSDWTVLHWTRPAGVRLVEEFSWQVNKNIPALVCIFLPSCLCRCLSLTECRRRKVEFSINVSSGKFQLTAITGAIVQFRSVSTDCIGLACIQLCCKQIFREIIYYKCNGYGKNLPGVL